MNAANTLTAVSCVEAAFRAGTEDLLDERALPWHRAAALLHLAERACKPTVRRPEDRLAGSRALLDEALRSIRVGGERC